MISGGFSPVLIDIIDYDNMFAIPTRSRSSPKFGIALSDRPAPRRRAWGGSSPTTASNIPSIVPKVHFGKSLTGSFSRLITMSSNNEPGELVIVATGRTAPKHALGSVTSRDKILAH